jgi:hypothetical protein
MAIASHGGAAPSGAAGMPAWLRATVHAMPLAPLQARLSPVEDFEREAREAGLIDRIGFLQHGQSYEFSPLPK